jgi:membrane-bound lytic murein transglycosylase D
MRATTRPPQRRHWPVLGWLAAVLLSACQWHPQAPTPAQGAIAEAPEPPTGAVIIAPVSIPPIARRAAPPPRPADLWQALRAGFALDHELGQTRVQQELRWLQRHPNYLPRLADRLQRYLPYIHAEVRARGLPGELALLPIVESALDPYAFSHGGAAGLWQFIPATATRFGLARNWWVDARRDPALATDAALSYLEYLYERFGDWNLAVAGYNAGEGNVARALSRAKGRTSFWELQLPRETRAYVPRLLALAAIVAEPESHGLTLPELIDEPTFVTIDIGGQFDLARAAAALEMDLDVLYQWNPALNQWATPPEGPHRLHVPVVFADTAEARIHAVPAGDRVQWQRVRVAPGDTLSQIARRHRTDVATLQRVNRISGTQIRAGQALFIPRSGQAPAHYPVARAAADADYRVAPGDSLWSIARAHGVSVASLVKTNQVGPKEVLRVGQRLSIPGGRSTAAAAPAAGRDVKRTVRYGVRRGDSLARIANRFNVAVNDIAQWNALDVNNYLRPGQQLVIHVTVAGGG